MCDEYRKALQGLSLCDMSLAWSWQSMSLQ